MLLLQSDHHWVWYCSFLGTDTFHLVTWKQENIRRRTVGGQEEMCSDGWILTWKKTPHMPSLGFSYICVCAHKHKHTHSTPCVQHFMYVHTHKHTTGTFNTGYHFITLIFKGIVQLLIKLLSFFKFLVNVLPTPWQPFTPFSQAIQQDCWFT